MLKRNTVFDKVFSVNVLQFLPERTAVLRMIRSVLKPDGVLATTVQPRHLGATAADVQAFPRRYRER
jgi:trans-aconitate methyltransferase